MWNIPLDPKVKRFFISFCRLEYALKRAGYVKIRGTRIDVEVDWTRFAGSIATAFDAVIKNRSNPKLASAVQHIRSNPPRKLVLVGEGESAQLHWARAGPKADSLDDLLVLVRRVRNNLFHGEKPATLIGGNQRGLELIEAAQEIIDACVSLDTDVQQYFEGSTQRIPRLDG